MTEKKQSAVKVEKPELTDRSLKQLQEQAVMLGMPQEDVSNFNTKAQLVSMIHVLEAKKAQITEGKEEIKRVKTLVQTESPKQVKTDKKRWSSKMERMRAKLMAQPTVKVLVPLEGKEKKGVVDWVYNERTKRKEQVYRSGAVLPVQLNGFRYFIAKGVYQDVPEQIAQVITESYNQTSEAGRDFLADRADPKMGGSVIDRLE